MKTVRWSVRRDKLDGRANVRLLQSGEVTAPTFLSSTWIVALTPCPKHCTFALTTQGCCMYASVYDCLYTSTLSCAILLSNSELCLYSVRACQIKRKLLRLTVELWTGYEATKVFRWTGAVGRMTTGHETDSWTEQVVRHWNRCHGWYDWQKTTTTMDRTRIWRSKIIH